MTTTADRPLTRRERTHAATVEEIKGIGRAHVASDGASSLNLRAIAREMGMTPSALYRYFDSRDALLTALIVDSYADVGTVVEAAAAAADLDTDPVACFLTVVHAFRSWALAHPHEWALLFGPPVPGYVAAEETLLPSLRTSTVLLELLREAKRKQLVTPVVAETDLSPRLVAAMIDVCGGDPGLPEASTFTDLSPAETASALACWSTLLGAIATELFGHLPPDAYRAPGELFDFAMVGSLARSGFDVTAWRAEQ